MNDVSRTRTLNLFYSYPLRFTRSTYARLCKGSSIQIGRTSLSQGLALRRILKRMVPSPNTRMSDLTVRAKKFTLLPVSRTIWFILLCISSRSFSVFFFCTPLICSLLEVIRLRSVQHPIAWLLPSLQRSLSGFNSYATVDIFYRAMSWWCVYQQMYLWKASGWLSWACLLIRLATLHLKNSSPDLTAWQRSHPVLVISPSGIQISGCSYADHSRTVCLEHLPWQVWYVTYKVLS